MEMQDGEAMSAFAPSASKLRSLGQPGKFNDRYAVISDLFWGLSKVRGEKSFFFIFIKKRKIPRKSLPAEPIFSSSFFFS